MAYIKDEIEIPGRKKLQAWLFGIGAFLGFIAFCAAKNGDGQGMLVCGAIGAGLIFIGTKVKTKKKLQHYGGTYR
jgi:hypothetical protein